MRATGLHRGWECKWQPGNSPNRFMEESLWAVIKMSTRFKLSSANKMCSCKTTVLQWNFPLQDVKERRKHCCTQGGDARPDCCPPGPNSPSLTPVVKTAPASCGDWPLFQMDKKMLCLSQGCEEKLLLWPRRRNMDRMPASWFLSSISWTTAHYQKSFASSYPAVPLQLSCEVVSSTNSIKTLSDKPTRFMIFVIFK